MIRKQLFVEKLRELGFKFLSQKDKIEIYKRSGDIRYASVRRRDLISEAEVRSTLRQAGQTEQQINAWIAGVLARMQHEPETT
jgi:parvulin-like peptidyl-prolyl isomerase